MTFEQFTARRLEELRGFFQLQFGRKWLKTLQRNMGERVLFFKLRQTPGIAKLCRFERYALMLGFKPSYADLKAFERTRLARVESLVNHLCYVGMLDCRYLPTSFKRCAEVVYHRIGRKQVAIDVIPEQSLASYGLTLRIKHPVLLPEPVSEAHNPATLADLMALPMVEPAPPQPVEADPQRGGKPTGHPSLSGSSAIQKPPRDEPPKKPPGIVSRRNAVTKALDAMMGDATIEKKYRQASLEKLHRQIEGTLLKLELLDN